MNDHLGTLRAALRRRRERLAVKRLLMSVLAVGLVALGLPLLAISPASAHTPSVSAGCGGITVSGSAYEAQNVNTLGIQLDGGVWTTKTFGTSGTLTVQVPQNDGLVHTWKAYVHTNNPNQAYSHDYPEPGQPTTIGPCGTKHVTALAWDKTPPTCAADGALVPVTEPEGIAVTRSPSSGTGPATYTITFTAKTGFANDGPANQTITVLPKLTGDQCATVVQPVAPAITNPACTGPGTGNAGSFTLPANGNGISYSGVGNVVTATADGTHKFVSLPSGWAFVDAHHATYTVTYSSPTGYPECLSELPTPVPPVAAAPTCDTDGDLVVGTTAHVVTAVDGTVVTEDTHYGAGSHVLTYTAAAGYTFAGGTLKTFGVKVASKTLDCPTTPVAPVVTQSVCDGPGTHTVPVVTTGEPGDHIGYAYDGVNQVVTATPDPGFALANLPTGWVQHEDGTATYVVTLSDPGACLVPVEVPTPPVASAPTCNLDGALTVAPTDHVVTTVDDQVVSEETSFGPGEHTIGYAPAEGYTFAGEPQTSFGRTVLPKTDDCPAGVVSPTVTQSVCTGPGTHSAPVVTVGDVEGDHVSYVYDATGHLVTATADAGFALSGLPAGWVLHEGGTATYAVVLTDPGTCAVTVVLPPTKPASSPHPSVLPNTGAPGSLAFVAGGGLLLIVAGGLLLRRRAA
ncbi:LPXTG cell wall anchor domain-containing protein [Marmoricola sp. URHA0025 HA25]